MLNIVTAKQKFRNSQLSKSWGGLGGGRGWQVIVSQFAAMCIEFSVIFLFFFLFLFFKFVVVFLFTCFVLFRIASFPVMQIKASGG